LHHVDEAEHVDLDVVVDGEPGDVLHGLHGQLRAAELVGRVDLMLSLAGDGHPRVPGQADDRDLAVVLGQVDDHHRVGPLTALPAQLEQVLLPPSEVVPLVHAHDQDVHRAARAGAADSGVDGADLADGQGGQRPGGAGAGEHQAGERPGEHEPAPPGPCPAPDPGRARTQPDLAVRVLAHADGRSVVLRVAHMPSPSPRADGKTAVTAPSYSSVSAAMKQFPDSPAPAASAGSPGGSHDEVPKTSSGSAEAPAPSERAAAPSRSRTWPPISVIMPVLNEERHLREAVRQVLNQAYDGPIEVV